MGWRIWKNRRRYAPEAALVPAPAAPDIHDEQTLADQALEEEWRSLALRLRAEGDFRGALRACFLAALACLHQGLMIKIVRSKSNLDYHRELVRKARRSPELPPVFAESIQLFERGWYGLHSVSPDTLDQAESLLKRIRQHVQE